MRRCKSVSDVAVAQLERRSVLASLRSSRFRGYEQEPKSHPSCRYITSLCMKIYFTAGWHQANHALNRSNSDMKSLCAGPCCCSMHNAWQYIAARSLFFTRNGLNSVEIKRCPISRSSAQIRHVRPETLNTWDSLGRFQIMTRAARVKREILPSLCIFS